MPWTDDDLTRALGELRDEPLPAEALAAVRLEVLARIHKPRRGWWWWLAPIPAAAALTFMLIPKPADVAPPPVIAKVPPAATFMHEKPVPVPARVKPASEQPRFLPTAQEGIVRLASSRKDIVILWDLGNQGDSE